MTNKEAINILNSLKQYYNDENEDSYVGFDNVDNKSIDMAIKVLEQQPCEDCISREEVIRIIKDHPRIVGDRSILIQKVVELPPVILTISEKETVEDCISRQVAIDTIESWLSCDDYNEAERHIMRAMQSVLYDLPSVTPQRKRGKWIEVEICNCHAALRCSVCDRVIEPTFTFGEYSYENIKKWYPFCHCGADMRGDTDETN